MELDKILKGLSVAVCTLALVTGCAATKTANSSNAGLKEEQPLYAASPEWVAKLGEKNKASQLFVVAAIGQTTAYVSMHEKTADGVWRQIISTPGFIGKYGIGKIKEGDAKTPTGTFHFNYAFGIADDPGCTAFDYKKVDDNDYWSGDTRKGYKYNQMVSISDYPDLNKDDSEHLIDYLFQYQYALNISYNDTGVPGLGSAIFLHCFGDQKPYTGGCVAIPRNYMETVMKTVHKDCVVVIDSLANLSPELHKKWNL
ncbi:MAG: L,D-transpeptidase family protein [Succinivibrio sp.]|nr:L,D-transpeptidase family protein [Succinivibrio sp.]